VPRHAELREPLAGGTDGLVAELVRVVDGDTAVLRVLSVPPFGYPESGQWRVHRRGLEVRGAYTPLPTKAGDPPGGRVVLTVAADKPYAKRIVLEPGARLRVRLAGIDAPEKRQRYGAEATATLDRLLRAEAGPDVRSAAPGFGGTLRVWINDVDRYGRAVALLWNHASGDINAAMVAAGAAWVYDRYAPVPNTYYLQEQRAQDARLGLWAALPTNTPALGKWRKWVGRALDWRRRGPLGAKPDGPTPPWVWRAQRRWPKGVGCDRCGAAVAEYERRSTLEQVCGGCARIGVYPTAGPGATSAPAASDTPGAASDTAQPPVFTSTGTMIRYDDPDYDSDATMYYSDDDDDGGYVGSGDSPTEIIDYDDDDTDA